MRYSRSGEYKLPGLAYRFCGNIALRIAPWIPSRIRHAFVRRRSSYQVFGEAELDKKQQGLSLRKWEAMQMPSDLSGKSVLDIGCAEGFFCLQAAKRGAAPVVGVDTSLGRLLGATFLAVNERLRIGYRMRVFPNLRLRRKFDYVLCLSVLHHSLAQKDLWRVLVRDEAANELGILREQLKVLRSLTADGGRCIVEIPYEYDEPERERKIVDFRVMNTELMAAGFPNAHCLGTWGYNPRHKSFKDRIIYVAEA
jgi:SAM-dependent methyltransferase